MDLFITDMRIAQMSPATIKARVNAIHRLEEFLGDTSLVDATSAKLRDYQASIAWRSPATVDIYSRHVRAFYAWAESREFVAVDPAAGMTVIRVHKGKPHPTGLDDLRVILAASRGTLRTAYVLAAFAGLRCGEICRLCGVDISEDSGEPIALIHGKGGKQRYVPFLPPVMAELGHYSRGSVVLNRHGRPYTPEAMSILSHRFLKELGIETTLHSMRHTFGTHGLRLTKDILLMRDLLGHGSVATTQIYTESDMADAHQRLGELTKMAEAMLSPRRLRSVR